MSARKRNAGRAGPVPICFLLDDGGPINPMCYHHPEQPHTLVVPNALWERFASFCREHDVRGKFSVLPCPSGMGRIDESIWALPEGHLDTFLAIMREQVSKQFDITPEIMTHQQVVDIRTGALTHWFEDEWVARQDVDAIAEYIALALRILKKVGLRAKGVTSPWATGNRNEKVYAAAISQAQWRVNRLAHTWYFLHVDTTSPRVLPEVTYRSRKHGRTVASITSVCGDFLWWTQYCRTRGQGLKRARADMESVLTRDGKSGRMRDLFEAGGPIVFHSHLQSLFSNGTFAGLLAFEELVGRIERAFGDSVRWATCSELAREHR